MSYRVERNYTCIHKSCNLFCKTIQTSRERFFEHTKKKQTEHVVKILKEIGIILPFEYLGRYTILNLFTDLCKEPLASNFIEIICDDVP